MLREAVGFFSIVDVETGKILYYSVAKGEGADYNEAVKEAVKKCIKPLQEI
jgi:phosphoribosylformylglycinamidine (FGAM) synthase PurS component